MGNACCSPDESGVVLVDNMGDGPRPEKDTSVQLTELGVSKDLTDFTSTRDMTDSILSEDFNSSHPMSPAKTFDHSLPRLAEDERPIQSFRNDQCYMLSQATEDELGSIRYAHDTLDAAVGEGLPILCVRAEMPGDRSAGTEVLSHPLIVEAAECLFETVGLTVEANANHVRYQPSAHHRNKPWYTTIEFFNEAGDCIVPIFGGEQLTVGKVASFMIEALRTCNRSTPTYLELLCEEESTKQRINASLSFKKPDRLAVFGVTDCHLAEVDFAGIDGVLQTQIGSYHGLRVLEVAYTGIAFASLLRRATDEPTPNIHTVYYRTVDERVAAQMELSRLSESPSIAKLLDIESINFSIIRDTKKALRQTELRFVPLTRLQAMRANRLVHGGSFHKATHLLSPRQGAILMKSYSNISLRKEMVDLPIEEAWKALKSMCEPDCACQRR